MKGQKPVYGGGGGGGSNAGGTPPLGGTVLVGSGLPNGGVVRTR